MAKTEANMKELVGKSIAKEKIQYPIRTILSPARECEGILIILLKFGFKDHFLNKKQL